MKKQNKEIEEYLKQINDNSWKCENCSTKDWRFLVPNETESCPNCHQLKPHSNINKERDAI